jgi:hypothetical protein
MANSVILDSQRPERLVDELDVEGLVAAVRKLDGWSERRLGAVDYVLRHWMAQVAARQDARSVAELQSAVGRILELRPPPDPYGHRWRALDDALEARRLTLAARDPERVAGMRHVSVILDHLRQAGPTKQGDLLHRLGLDISISRLSQIVSLMEAHGLVEVERRGRESFLRATSPDPRRARPEDVPPAAPHEREPTTRQYLLRTG